MEYILLAYGIKKKPVAAIMMLYTPKSKVRSPFGDIDYFNIVAGVVQGDTLAPYLFIICLDYMLRISIDKIKENGFKLTKERSRRYPAKIITNAGYTDNNSASGKCTRPSRNPCCIVWNEQLQTLASMSMHTKRNICALIKQATSSH